MHEWTIDRHKHNRLKQAAKTGNFTEHIPLKIVTAQIATDQVLEPLAESLGLNS
jgi:4-hydroxy-L-threonine phosphate dehydrogenase PdxA